MTARAALPVLLAALAPGLLGPVQARGDRLPDWAEEARAAVDLERYSGEDAVVLLQSWDLELRPDGRRGGLQRRVVQVLTDSGRDAAAVLLVSGAFAEHRNVRVWVRLPGGDVRAFDDGDGTLFGIGRRSEIDGGRVLWIEPPALQPGSTVAVQSEYSATGDLPQDRIPLESEVPVARVTVRVAVRGERRVAARVSAPLEATQVAEGSWEFRDLPARSVDDRLAAEWAPEPPRAILVLDYPGTGGAAFDRWERVADWYRRLFERAERGGPDVERVAREAGLASGRDGSAAPDPVEAAGAVARSLRYFSIALGWGGYVPRDPQTSLRRGFGDCKDKTQLAIALLGAAGIEAWPVLVMAPSDGHVPDDLPALGWFNHVVVGIPWGERPRRPGMAIVEDPALGPLRLFDGTLPPGFPQDVSTQLAGAAALALHPSSGGLLRIPGGSVEDNRLRIERWIRLHDGYEAEVEVEAQGAWRALWAGPDGPPRPAERLREELWRDRALEDPELEVTEVRGVEIDDVGAWSLGYRVISPRGLARFGAVAALDLPSPSPIRLFPEDLQDERSIVLPFRGALEETTVIETGPWRHEGGPESQVLENDLGRVALQVEETREGLHVRREVELRVREVPPARRAELERLREAWIRAERVTLLFDPP